MYQEKRAMQQKGTMLINEMQVVGHKETINLMNDRFECGRTSERQTGRLHTNSNQTLLYELVS